MKTQRRKITVTYSLDQEIVSQMEKLTNGTSISRSRIIELLVSNITIKQLNKLAIKQGSKKESFYKAPRIPFIQLKPQL